MEKLNVEDIMDEIRRDLKPNTPSDAGDAQLALGGEEAEHNQYRLQKETFEVLEHLKYEHELQDYREMGSGFKAAIKKAIQKMVRLIIVPIVGQQNNFNAYSVRGMELLRQEDESLRETVSELRAQVMAQEQLLQEYQLQFDRMAKAIDELEAAAK